MEQIECRISIIIPCYNQAKYLPDTLESVLLQTYNAWECIIVNDGSPDNTGEVARKYCERDRRFRYVYKNNGGLADARNYGIGISSGEFILALDSDDKIAPTYVEKAIQYFDKNPETTLVYCKADRFDGKQGPWDLPKYKYENLLWENCIFCSAIFKRSDYNKTTGYNINMKCGLEDWDFWLSLLHKDSLVYRIEEVLFHYRYREGSMISHVKAERRKEMLWQILLNHKDIYINEMEKMKRYHDYKNAYEIAMKSYETVINSWSYRLGNFLLSPFIEIRNLVNKFSHYMRFEHTQIV